MPRFFSAKPITGDRVTLGDAEAHHLAHVMRISAGDVVTLFDGTGWEFAARVERISKRGVDLVIESRSEIDRELLVAITLAVALPKGERQRWLVEKAVEFGVARLVPLVTTRGVAVASAAVDRLRRGVIEASKQCGRNRLMEISAPMPWPEFARLPVEETTRRWFASLTAREPPGMGEVVAKPPSAATIAVGPEGDWTDEETAVARDAGWSEVWLGPRILRVESAAIALAVIAGNCCAAERP